MFCPADIAQLWRGWCPWCSQYHAELLLCYSATCSISDIMEDENHRHSQGGIIKFASWERAAFTKYFAQESVIHTGKYHLLCLWTKLHFPLGMCLPQPQHSPLYCVVRHWHHRLWLFMLQSLATATTNRRPYSRITRFFRGLGALGITWHLTGINQIIKNRGRSASEFSPQWTMV